MSACALYLRDTGLEILHAPRPLHNSQRRCYLSGALILATGIVFGALAMTSGLVVMLIIFACWAVAFRQITGRWPRGDEWLPE